MGCCSNKDENSRCCCHEMDLNKFKHLSISSFNPDEMRINGFSTEYTPMKRDNSISYDTSSLREKKRGSTCLNSVELLKVQEFGETMYLSPKRDKDEGEENSKKRKRNTHFTDTPSPKKKGNNGLVLLKTLGSLDSFNTVKEMEVCDMSLSPKKRFYATDSLNRSPKKQLKALDKKTVVFLIYPSGTNKDEAVFNVFKDYGFEKISVGSLIRECGVKHPDYGSEILKDVFKRKDVSSSIVVNLILEKIMSSDTQRFLISGFPKNEDNSITWRQIVGSRLEVAAVVMLTYTRKEYEFELNERSKKDGTDRIDFRHAMYKFDYYITETNKVPERYGESKCIRISAKLDDHLMATHLLKHDLITSKLW